MEREAVEYEFSKDRLPRGSSHPLRRFHALGGIPDAGVTAAFDGETTERVPARPGMIRIRVAAVPSQRRRAYEHVLLRRALPALIEWMSAAEAAGGPWRATDHWFAAGVKGTDFAVRHDPLPPR